MSIKKQPLYIDLDLNTMTTAEYYGNANPITGDLVLKKDDDAIKQSIRILVLTKFYERVMYPMKGSQISAALFELDSPNTRTIIRQSIFNVLSTFEPRILVEAVDIEYDDMNGYDVAIRYTIIAKQITSTVSIFLDKIK